MHRTGLILAAVAALLSGCATNPVPEGYTGPIARIQDTMSNDGNGIDFFYLAKVNGRTIENSLAATTEANAGMGAYMKPVVIGRDFGTKVEIVSGLTPADRIIINPADSLSEGDSVKVAQSKGE